MGSGLDGFVSCADHIKDGRMFLQSVAVPQVDSIVGGGGPSGNELVVCLQGSKEAEVGFMRLKANALKDYIER